MPDQDVKIHLFVIRIQDLLKHIAVQTLKL